MKAFHSVSGKSLNMSIIYCYFAPSNEYLRIWALYKTPRKKIRAPNMGEMSPYFISHLSWASMDGGNCACNCPQLMFIRTFSRCLFDLPPLRARFLQKGENFLQVICVTTVGAKLVNIASCWFLLCPFFANKIFGICRIHKSFYVWYLTLLECL